MKQDKATTSIPVQVGMKVKHSLINKLLTVAPDEKGPAYTGNEFADDEISLSHAIQEYKMGNLTIPVNDELDIESNGEWVADGRVITLADDYSYEIAKFERHGECKAAVEAYNETYGKGYNPAAMEELYKALEHCVIAISGLIPGNVAIDNPIQMTAYNAYHAAKTALHNAKTIKP